MQSKSKPEQIYISYIKSDKDLKKLVDVLTQELRRRGYEIWSGERISPGEKWADEIEKALKDSDAMIALLNQHSFSSSYVRNELEHAFFNEQYKNRFLPVFISSSSDEDFSRLPWVLTKITFLKIEERRSVQNKAKIIADKFETLLGRGGSRS